MTEEKALVTVAPGSYGEIVEIARAMAQSGFFKDIKSISQAIVKIQAGKEFGFGPFASMVGINIIGGKPAVGGNLMAAKIKAHPRYDYQVARLDNEACEIAFYQDAQEIGRSTFTMEDARAAEVGKLVAPGASKNMLTRFTRNMLFNRALSNGQRWYCPDVFMGSPVYTPDELGATLDAEGSVIDVTPTVKPPEPTPPPIAGNAIDAISEVFGDEAGAEYAAEVAPHWIEDPKARTRFWAWTGTTLGLTNDEVHSALNVASVKDFTGTMADAKALIEAYADAQAHQDSEQPF